MKGERIKKKKSRKRFTFIFKIPFNLGFKKKGQENRKEEK